MSDRNETAMSSILLQRLTTDEFADSIGFVLPPAPLRRVLQHSPVVQQVSTALRYGQITGEDVRNFVGQLLLEFRQGELFRHDIVLAALAVAMDHWRNSFAEEYLIDLARIQRPEFRASTRIARECLKARYAFPKTHVRDSRYPRGGSAPNIPRRIMSQMAPLRHDELRVVDHLWLTYSGGRHAVA